MNENDKAATYIGWNPATVCQGDKQEHTQLMCPELLDYWHIVAAPDMSDPRNYMKALEAIRKWGDGNLNIGNCYSFTFHHVPKDIRIDTKRSFESAGDALVNALAALYDAEHAE